VDKIRKMEGGYHGQTRNAWFFWREALNRQIFIIGYQQWVERENLHVALLSTEFGASTLALCGWYRNTPQEWHREAARKFPRRWQRFDVITSLASL
jgi:hypothetical protein